jgi:hypothetical protein
MLTYLRQTSLLLLLIFPTLLYAKVGDVIEQKGRTNIERGSDTFKEIDKEFDVESMDTVRTKDGRTSIQFIDETRVDVTEHSKLVIDDFVYDPNTKTGSLSLKASFGTIRYASGQIAKNSRQNVKIKTPTATVGVRGTDFSMTVDELGSSTIVLLPSCNTNYVCVVGEISVSSEVGMVIMNQAFQATVVPSPYATPMRPVVLDLDERSILNLLIRRTPVEIDDQLEKIRVEKLADFLGIDFLDFDILEEDKLKIDERKIWSTGLDIDFLANTFLVDILDVLNRQLALQMRGEFEKSSDGIKLGKDPDTGIEIYDEETNWLFRRDSGSHIFEMNLNKNNTYNINLKQDALEFYDIRIGESGRNEVTIIQID